MVIQMLWFRSDDPVKDAERYQRAAENRPCLHCVLCGQPLYEGDTYFDIQDEVWCEDCAMDEFRKKVDLE